MLTPIESWRKSEDGQRNSRIVSLWELMEPFWPGIFIRAVEVLRNGRRPNPRSRERKLPLNIEEAVAELQAAKEDHRELSALTYEVLAILCKKAGLKASAATLRTMGEALEHDPDRTSSKEWEAEFRGRLIDEMMETLFFSLSLVEADYFNEPRKGWEKIIVRFSNIAEDVEEARKCFALARYPAAVFHSLQIVESGLIELGRFIQVSDPHSGWTAVSNQLRKIVCKKYHDRTEFERDNFQFLEQVQGTVEALKNAWRNKISHAQGKLTLLSKEFTPEVAEEILLATRALMRRLAEGLPFE